MGYAQVVRVEGDSTATPVSVSTPPGTSLAVSIVTQTTATPTLTAATTGDGTTVDHGSAKANTSMIIIVNGTVTAGVVDLQVSQNGSDWVKISSSSTLATGVNQQLTLSSAAYRYARGVVSTTVTGGGSVTATIMAV